MNRAEKRAYVSRDKDITIDYAGIVKAHPWLIARDLDCILSPDADGFLCGLLMAKTFGWKIRGFFDSKNLLLQQGYQPSNCVFLDIEIFRPTIKSIGHHWLMPGDFKPYRHLGHANAVNPHFYRPIIWDLCRSVMTCFFAKYPFGTVHFLMGILEGRATYPMPDTALEPLMFADGTYGNISSYGENCLHWSRFLGADDKKSMLHKVFRSPGVEFFEMAVRMDDFYAQRDEFSADGIRADRALKTVFDRLEPTSGTITLNGPLVDAAEKFIEFMGNRTGWHYNREDWSWSDLNHRSFTKRTEVPRVGAFGELFSSRPYPVCWAVTAGNQFEYTIPGPDDLP